MKRFGLFLGFLFFLFPLLSVSAEDNLGFGFSGEEAGPAGSSVSNSTLKIDGKVQAELLGYVDAFHSLSQLKNMKAGDIFSGKLNFSASGSAANGVISLNLAPTAAPLSINE
ncbi:MAG: hypothetical protein LBT93_07030, partial [Treponema sp.]|nr:hypothetical protein [Treponema sp.]